MKERREREILLMISIITAAVLYIVQAMTSCNQ